MTIRGVNQQRIDPSWSGLTWTWNQLILGSGVVGAPFNQLDWPNPTQPLRIDETWLWRQVNQLGQGRPTAQYDWPNPQPVQWYRDWEVNLAGVLKAPFQQLDWPNPVPPYRIDQTWTQSHTSFTGQDRLPNRQQDWPTPPPVQWFQEYRVDLLQTTLKPAPQAIPFLQFDWPNPTPVSRLSDYSYISFVVNPPLPVPPTTPTTGGWTEWTETDVQNQAAFWKKTANLEHHYNNIRQAAVELGRKGGEARMKTMTAFERQTYAKKAAEARWGKKK